MGVNHKNKHLRDLQRKSSELIKKYSKIFEQRDKVPGLSEENEKLTCKLESVRIAMIDLDDEIQNERIAVLEDELELARKKVDDITNELEIQETRVALLKDNLRLAKEKFDSIREDLKYAYNA